MAMLHVIGAPLDLGAGRRGVDMGPSAIRLAQLHRRIEALGHTVVDRGNVAVPGPEESERGDSAAKFADAIGLVCDRTREQVEGAFEAGAMPLVLGGDHSVAIGTIAACSANARAAGGELAVLWVDAHADINTPETSPSGNIHGMPLSHCLGLGLESLATLGGFAPKLTANRVAIVGLRAVDARERDLLRETGVRAYSMTEIDRRGMSACVEEAVARITDGAARLHLSFDIDGVDPSEAPGVGTPAPGGLTYREAHLLMELVAETDRLTSMEMVEVNPVLDEHNRTAQLAVGLIASALGKRIL